MTAVHVPQLYTPRRTIEGPDEVFKACTTLMSEVWKEVACFTSVGNFCSRREVLASQEGLWYMELVINDR